MIIARNYQAKPIIGVPNPAKAAILGFMKDGDEDGLGEGYVRNFATGETDKRHTDDAFVSHDLFWRAEDTYNFEHNDLELSPEFCARVLELIGQ